MYALYNLNASSEPDDLRAETRGEAQGATVLPGRDVPETEKDWEVSPPCSKSTRWSWRRRQTRQTSTAAMHRSHPVQHTANNISASREGCKLRYTHWKRQTV